ncbi:hypothetical protein N656DRAFT_781073 [Canariomyces notabilis]|uniref:Secreted protein n=1 Tax=Canariomyces notabilis TaxID=2074819 RepID=A0AAN6YRB0_9PEZI|nr:hypothetical protein N656DRAFT_781073 [Canariomyces arenarius]
MACLLGTAAILSLQLLLLPSMAWQDGRRSSTWIDVYASRNASTPATDSPRGRYCSGEPGRQARRNSPSPWTSDTTLKKSHPAAVASGKISNATLQAALFGALPTPDQT